MMFISKLAPFSIVFLYNTAQKGASWYCHHLPLPTHIHPSNAPNLVFVQHQHFKNSDSTTNPRYLP